MSHILGASAIAETGSRASTEPASSLRPSGFDPARIVEYIVPRLGKAQRRVLLSLTDDWGKAVCHQTARRMFWGVTDRKFTLVHHKHRTDNCWCLSDLGQRVKDAIAGEARSGETVQQGSTGTASTRAEGIAQTPIGTS